MAEERPDLRNPLAPARESLIDKQIREAQRAGAFDDLPHQGQRLPLVDDAAAGEWALAYRMLKNANFAPPWIEADKEVRALLARRDAILRVNHEAPTERQHRRPLDLEAELATLDRAHAGEG